MLGKTEDNEGVSPREAPQNHVGLQEAGEDDHGPSTTQGASDFSQESLENEFFHNPDLTQETATLNVSHFAPVSVAHPNQESQPHTPTAPLGVTSPQSEVDRPQPVSSSNPENEAETLPTTSATQQPQEIPSNVTDRVIQALSDEVSPGSSRTDQTHTRNIDLGEYLAKRKILRGLNS